MRLIFSILFCFPFFVNAQVLGGESQMEFLRLSQSAHVSAMGGLCVNTPGNDVSLVTANPALLSEKFHSHLSLNYNGFYAKSKFMSSNYAHYLPKYQTTIGIAVQYLNHGAFTMTDPIGNINGTTHANEYSIQASIGKAYKGNIRYGSTIKFANTQLSDKSASALLIDFGITSSDTNRNWYLGGIIKNAGLRLKNYIAGQNQPLPFDIQLGVLKKFNKAPFSIYVIGHHLYTWDIRYDNPADKVNNQLIFGDSTATKEKSYFADKLFRHVNVGVGLNIGKRIEFNVAYSHQRRAELGLSDKKGMAGFSMGLSLYFPKLVLQYTRSTYHLAGAQNEIGVNLKLDKLFGIAQLKS
jgi:hypothetical protein